MNHLPDKFLERLQLIIPADCYAVVYQSFSQQKPIAFRANTLKISPKQLQAALKSEGFNPQPVDWLDNAFLLPAAAKSRLTTCKAYLNGELYIQNLSSMLPPILLDPKPGEEILDLTAAPGSKTCQLAAIMQNKGRIAAVEKSKPRFFKLKDNLKRQGTSCVDTYLKDGSIIWRYCANRFDRVLLDAPCSSEGRFNALDSATFQYWRPKKIKSMAAKQWQLLYSAFLCLKPGGTLIYSTCTFAPEENEAVINKLLKTFPNEAIISEFNLPIDNIQSGLAGWQKHAFDHAVKNCVRILPNASMMGFFLAKIMKKK